MKRNDNGPMPLMYLDLEKLEHSSVSEARYQTEHAPKPFYRVQSSLCPGVRETRRFNALQTDYSCEPYSLLTSNVHRMVIRTLTRTTISTPAAMGIQHMITSSGLGQSFPLRPNSNFTNSAFKLYKSIMLLVLKIDHMTQCWFDRTSCYSWMAVHTTQFGFQFQKLYKYLKTAENLSDIIVGLRAIRPQDFPQFSFFNLAVLKF